MRALLPACAMLALSVLGLLALSLRPLPGGAVALVFRSAAAAEAALPLAMAAGWLPLRIDAGWPLLHLLPAADAAPPPALRRIAGALLALSGRPLGGCSPPVKDLR